MRWQPLIIGMYRRMSQEMAQVLNGLTTEDLHKRPSPGANPIGWLCWHTTRSLDWTVGDVISGEQVWIKDGWHKTFHPPPEPNDTGCGHTDAQVDNLKIPDIKTLLDYHRAVMKPLINYLERLTEQELDRECKSSQHPGTTAPAHSRLVGVLIYNLQYIGQAAYVRGLIKGHGWYGR
jgi:hypothetical protein